MTGDFTPPGSSIGGARGNGNRPDAPGTSASITSGYAAGVGTEQAGGAPRSMFRAGQRVAAAAWIAIAAGVALLIGIAWSAALAWSDQTTNFATVGDTGTMSAAQIVPGMCLSALGEDGSVQDVDVVHCNEPHRAEVFTQLNYDLAKHPGVDEVSGQALDFCADRLTGLLPEGATWVTWTPSPQSWSRGDRVALCIAVFDKPLSEPLSPRGIQGIDNEDTTDRDGLSA